MSSEALAKEDWSFGGFRRTIGATGSCPRGSTSRNARAAALMESMIFVYPVHRQKLPAKASLIAASLGSGNLSRRTLAEIIMPGVQNPHLELWDHIGSTGVKKVLRFPVFIQKLKGLSQISRLQVLANAYKM